MRNTRLGSLAATTVVVLLIAGCGGGSDEAAPAASTEGTTTATTSPPPPPPATTTAANPPAAGSMVETVRIVVRGGKPVGGIVRPSVKQGDKVRIVVRSDIADEVHVHGYDLMQDVPAGGSTTIAFTATIPGRFEVELENRGLQLAEIEVTP
jgi:hypothetical protein